MVVETIFIAIVIGCAIVGMKKGEIWSIGSLIALILSIFLSRKYAVPLTEKLLHLPLFKTMVEQVMELLNLGLVNSNSLSVNLPIDIGGLNETINTIIKSVSGIVNANVLYIGSRFVMMLLFSVFMFVFGIILKILNLFIRCIPCGVLLNGIVGTVCGAIKGIVVVCIMYGVICCINTISGINIPVNIGLLNGILGVIPHVPWR